MLRELRIENFAIIEQIDLSFAAGLNILTGETGAGKSVIVDALELLFGARATADQIRTGSDQAVIEVVIEIPGLKALRGPLEEQGYLSPGEDDLILRRILSRSGKGRIQVNGNLVTLSALQEIGRGLVDIHGQHDHQSLFFQDRQTDLLDAYGQLLPMREQYAEIYQQQRDLKAELESLKKTLQEKGQREEYLRYQVQEIESVGLQAGEEERLEQEREVLAHSGKLSLHADSAYQAVYESEESLLGSLLRVGDHFKELHQIDSRFNETLDLWNSALAQFKEAADQLRRYKSTLEHDPERLQEIEERLYRIGKLKKKYGATSEDILTALKEFREELSSLADREEQSLAVESALNQVSEKVQDLAVRLTGRRVQTAKKFKSELEKELKHLGMGKTEFLARMDSLDGDLGPRGAERIHFLIATQPGEDPKPLGRVASGGELSRLMLAIKTILAEADQVPVLIFDEVDAGIGGAVAEAVGKRLKAIARKSQVFCITHLPQIAKFADTHYRVEKDLEKGRSVTRVRKLNSTERVNEMARMLGGTELTPITLRHAKELLGVPKG